MNRPATPGHRPCAARGSIYVAVLGASVLATTLGLSALLACRLAERQSSTASQATHAAFLAESAVELALQCIDADSNWRQNYPHNSWTAPRPLGGGTVCFKLVDPDGDLTDDPAQPLRLYGKGQAGRAVRIVSLDLEPVSLPINFLKNADLEAGSTTGWYRYTGTASLAIDSANPHGGDYALHVYNRTYEWAGPVQIVTGSIENGQPLEMQAWIRLGSTSEKVVFYLRVNGSKSGDYWFSAETSPAQTDWTLVTATLSPSWSGNLNYAYWSIGTKNSTQEMWVDDAVLYKQGQPTRPSVRPVAGSWRRDLDG